MKYIIITFFLYSAAIAQVSIHQEQSEHYGNLGIADDDFSAINTVASVVKSSRGGCEPNKIVFGWHPYWSNGYEANYDWDLITDLSFFSYEVDANTGNALSTHGWATNNAVTQALAQGKRVNLCVTLFSSHATFFGNPTAVQTLITNLINLVQSRGAQGVNIDFEGIPASQKTNFTNFMINLSNQMHTAIPGSQVSTVLYAVDWNNVFDMPAMNPFVDLFIIMGYDYYWTNSTTAGPNDPLFHFGSTYNYNLSRSISHYLNAGASPSKLIMGLPFYGRSWPTASLTVPSSTTGSGSAVLYRNVESNASGNYTPANRGYDGDSFTRYYTFMSSGEPRQTFIISQHDFSQRLKVINRFGIGGMGIWALGYDDGYTHLWDEIYDNFTDCGSYTACNDTIFDMGGPNKNYYNNENYTFTIAPEFATTVTFNFTQFNVENNFDFLYIYDGPDASSPQIAGSPFTGTNSPGTFTSTGGSVTFRFTSDGATVAPGWRAIYQCTIDNIPPTVTIDAGTGWKTQDFTATFTDTDNIGGTGVSERYLCVIHNDGTDWRANAQNGFFSDNFDNTIHSDWIPVTGTWAINNGALEQSNQANTNTSISAFVNQNDADAYMYHWSGAISGSGSNRRAGLHFMADDASLPNRGNSYFVWFRADGNKIQIYETINDVFYLVKESNYSFNAGQWYDFKTTYKKVSGRIDVYINNQHQVFWIDATPRTAGDYISFRSGDAIWTVDNMKVFKTRISSEIITVGAGSDLPYDNFNPLTNAGKIKAFAIDNARNISMEAQEELKVDVTPPSTPTIIHDGTGADINVFNDATQISANWNNAIDANSDISGYEYAIGTTALGTDVISWTPTTNTTITHYGLSLTPGLIYYTSVRAINGAGLIGLPTCSDGALLDSPVLTPIAGFDNAGVVNLCEGEAIQFTNTSQHATSFVWTFQNGTPANSTDVNPTVIFPSSGTYNVELEASGPGGTDVINQTITLVYHPQPIAAMVVTDTMLALPNAIAGFTNQSQNHTTQLWQFGDGSTSTSNNPFHQFQTTGTFPVMLTVSNGICPIDTVIQLIYVGITDINNSNWTNVHLYPNPANNYLNISSSEGCLNINLFDAYGRLILTENCIEKNAIIDVSNLSSGIYFAKISGQYSILETTFKVIIETRN